MNKSDESMFNEEQREHMAALESILPERRCWCGWYMLGECPHCLPGRTCAEKIAARCPECGSSPASNGRSMIHYVGCSKSGT